MEDKKKTPKITGEKYLAVTYRPVGLNPISRPDPYGHDLTKEINRKIEEAIEDSEASISTGCPVRYRIINVTGAIDPRVSTQPGLDSMIYVAHIAYWHENK